MNFFFVLKFSLKRKFRKWSLGTAHIRKVHLGEIWKFLAKTSKFIETVGEDFVVSFIPHHNPFDHIENEKKKSYKHYIR